MNKLIAMRGQMIMNIVVLFNFSVLFWCQYYSVI